MSTPVGSDPSTVKTGTAKRKAGQAPDAQPPAREPRRKTEGREKEEEKRPVRERRRPRSLDIAPPGTAQNPAPTVPTGEHTARETREERERVTQRRDRAQVRAERRRARGRENARVPLNSRDEKVVADFGKEERAAYRKLSADERARYRKVNEYLYHESAAGKQDSASRSAQEGLQGALRNGALLKVDRNGTTALEHFAKRVGENLAPGLEAAGERGWQQLGNMARQIGLSGTIFQGAGTKDCVAASLELQLARREPGEFMRVATGLVFDGRARLEGPDGRESVMRLDASALDTDRGPRTRNSTNQLIQQSFMTYARESFPAGTGSQPWVGGARDKGLTLRQAEGLYENLTGARGAGIKLTEANDDRALAAILEAGRSGNRFQVGLGTTAGGHMVSLLGIKEDRKGKPVARYVDSASGKVRKMAWSEFRKLIKGAVIPSEFAGQLAGNKSGKEDFGGTATPVDPSAITLPAGQAGTALPAQASPPPPPPPPPAAYRPAAVVDYWGRRRGGGPGRR